ncbi:MAG: glycosyltransferase family 4 protein [Armatimonas sp.]
MLTSNTQIAQPGEYTPNLPVERLLEGIPRQCGFLELQSRNIKNAATTRQFLKRIQPDFIIAFGNDGVGFNVYEAVLQSDIPSLTWMGDTWLGQAWTDLPRYDAWIGLACGGNRTGPISVAKKALGFPGKASGLHVGFHPSAYKPVCALSDYVLQRLIQAGAPVSGKEKIIPVILDNFFFDSDGNPVGHSGVRTRTLRALFVSRMEYLKGPDTAIRAVADARKRGGNIHLTLAGFQMHAYQNELETLAKELGVHTNITWSGSPPNAELLRLYRNHDVFLFPSRINEGLGAVNCEALACGLPIIGTAHSGSAEVIQEGITGFRVSKDHPLEMSERLLYLDKNREVLEAMSQKVTDFSHKFHWTHVISQFEAEMHRIIAEGG